MGLSDVKNIRESLKSAASAISLELGPEATEVLENFASKANREVVRKARVRFDVFAMHMWRSFISTFRPEDRFVCVCRRQPSAQGERTLRFDRGHLRAAWRETG
eukprot:5738821-Pyramimonas_sp.AAC.1